MLYKLYKCDRPIRKEPKSNCPAYWKNYLRLSLLSFALVSIADANTIASAQIVPDNTLPQNSIVTPDGSAIEITGGTTQGNNLFHSFQEFSVLNGQTAFFDNAC